jgi:hypothetical protein
MQLTLTDSGRSVGALVDQARDVAVQALQAYDLADTNDALSALGVTDQRCYELLRAVSEQPSTTDAIRRLRSQIATLQAEPPAGAVERVLLLRALMMSLPMIQAAPLADSVKRLFCEEVHLVAAPPPSVIHRFNAARNVYVAFCKVATVRRFPAGQLHWEISGFPRSWLLKAKARDLPRLVRCLVRTGGRAPMFQIHLNANRKDRAALLERESNRAYYRIARSLELQPHVKGLVTASWLHSLDTLAASPHLIALNRVFLEHGALVLTIGPAELDCGVFTRSPERRRLYEQGLFTPTTGLVLWPRREMLAWAAAHPELAD